MASLNTFGSIMTYAIELEARLHDYYHQAGNLDRAKIADKNRSKLERVRRENVTEIKLEPIDGLDEANYDFDLSDTSAEGQQRVESMAARFYADVAPKMNVREAERMLNRVGKQHAQFAEE